MNSIALVSIVIPAFNPRFFETALQSALAQTYSNIEIIVCDDSPTDEVKRIYDSLAENNSAVVSRYYRNTRRLGFAANAFSGFRHARGAFVKFLCDDDRLFPSCVMRQAQALSEHADVSLVIGQRQLQDAEGIALPARLNNLPWVQSSALFKGADLVSIFKVLPRNLLGSLSGALMRSSDVAQLVTQFDSPKHGYSAILDLALYIRLLMQGNLVVLSQVLSIERLHPDQWSRQKRALKLLGAESNRLRLMLDTYEGDGEVAPARGWIRFVTLGDAVQIPRRWEELNISFYLGTQHATLPFYVGVGASSFAEMYGEWLACRTISAPDRASLPAIVAGWERQPSIVPIVIDDRDDKVGLNMTLASLAAQDHAPAMTIVLSRSLKDLVLGEQVSGFKLQDNWALQLNELVPQLEIGCWFYLLRAGDRLTESALLMLEERRALNADARCIYSDEGALRGAESAEPIFKPDFNLDFMRGYPYVGRALAFDCERFVQLGGFSSQYGELAPHDLLWRLIETDGFAAAHHVSEVLVESTFSFSQWLSMPQVIENNPLVLGAHLTRMGVDHRIRHGNSPLICDVEYVHDDRPLVSIVIKHKDELPALQRCLDSLMEKTAYGRYEIIVVDNASVGSLAISWLESLSALPADKIRVVYCPTEVSFAGIHNDAVSHARGDYVVILSPYAVITHSDWLDALLNHAQRPEVGVVGAKIFGAQGHVLHAGLILGGEGSAGRAFFGAGLNTSGYMSRLQLAQNPSAIGQDCLMVRTSVWLDVGGFDQLAINEGLSSTDLCLRIRQHGFLIVWTPNAMLAMGSAPVEVAHADVRSRQVSEQEAFYLRWLPVVARDPAYNKNLSLKGSSFELDPGERFGWSPIVDRQLPRILGVPVNTPGVGHYRVIQPFKELEAAAIAIGQLAYRRPSIIEVERHSPDVIVLQGCYTEATVKEVCTLKTYSNARRVYELDDYLISVPKQNEHLRNLPADMERLIRQGTSLCDRLVVSTDALANAMSSMHHDIRVVPNTLSPHLWTGLNSRRRTSVKPRVGWAGGTSHAGDLRIIAEVIRELADEVEWVFFGMCPPDLRPYLHEFYSTVDMQAYPARLASLNLDLALAPLEYHIFNDCKSNLRLLEYGACAYPVICTDTQAYRGDLPCTRVATNTTQEWLQAIRMHLADPDASYRMGDALQASVMRDFVLRGDVLQQWVKGWLAD